MEKYLVAAELVAAAVIDTRNFSNGLTQTFNADRTESTAGSDPDGEGFRMLGSIGLVSANVETLSEGKYKIRIRALATQAGDEFAKMALQIKLGRAWRTAFLVVPVIERARRHPQFSAFGS